MRVIWSIFGLILVAVVIIFAVQNTSPVTVSLFGMSLTSPIAIVAIGFYLLGMATGSTFFAALRRSFLESKKT